QDIQAAERSLRRLDEPRRRAWVRNIDSEGVRFRLALPQFGGGLLGVLQDQVADGDTGAFGRRRVADLLADTAAAAGDQHGPVLKAHRCPPLYPERQRRYPER